MSQVVPAFVGTVRTGILEGLASGTSRDVPSSSSFCWDCQDWDSRGASIWDFPGCPKYSQSLLGSQDSPWQSRTFMES